MSIFEEEIVAALQRFFVRVETLQQITIRDLLKPGVYLYHERIL